MLRTLGQRLIASHILPVLIMIPIAGLALGYVLETQVLLPALTEELESEAQLVADLVAAQPAIWHDTATAEGFVENIGQRLGAHITIMDLSLAVVAEDTFPDSGSAVSAPTTEEVAAALQGKTVVVTNYSPRLHAEVAEILTPIHGQDGAVLGFLWLRHRLTSAYDDFLRMRYLIAAVMAAGLLISAAAGWLLAAGLARPLRRLTEAVSALPSERKVLPLPRNAPTEIAGLITTFNSLTEQLHAMQESRRQLLANLVHELGRPLGAVQAAVHALRGGADQDAELRDELLLGIEGELAQLRRLLDDLARLREHLLDTPDLERQAIPLHEWLRTSTSTWASAAQAKGLRWSLTVPDYLPAVSIDPLRLAQAVGNLLSNAVKYTPTGGSVDVSAGSGESDTWIEVRDSGPGISPEEQEKVFDPFFRGRVGGRFPRGMGLGLTIARDIVRAHGGRLEARPNPSGGTIFTVHLPAAKRGVGAMGGPGPAAP